MDAENYPVEKEIEVSNELIAGEIDEIPTYRVLIVTSALNSAATDPGLFFLWNALLFELEVDPNTIQIYPFPGNNHDQSWIRLCSTNFLFINQ